VDQTLLPIDSPDRSRNIRVLVDGPEPFLRRQHPGLRGLALDAPCSVGRRRSGPMAWRSAMPALAVQYLAPAARLTPGAQSACGPPLAVVFASAFWRPLSPTGALVSTLNLAYLKPQSLSLVWRPRAGAAATASCAWLTWSADRRLSESQAAAADSPAISAPQPGACR